jgi:hypothetical protein
MKLQDQHCSIFSSNLISEREELISISRHLNVRSPRFSDIFSVAEASQSRIKFTA